jgi:hypothetical protein
MEKLSIVLKGFFILVISFSGMVFYESCCGTPDFAFYDIESFDILVEKRELAPNDTLKMFTVNQKYKYLSATSSLFPKAYAWECLSDGHMGPKYNYIDVKITSEKALDDLHPAGTNLNDLFLLLPYRAKPYPLDKVKNIDSVAKIMASGYLVFGMAKKPSSNTEMEFLIHFMNSNNREITVKTPPIRWN